MPRYIAFLRAINVQGRRVKMDVLRAHFESLGLGDVETFIASGNVVFSSRAKNASTLEKKIEKSLLGAFGFEVATFLRTDAELAAISEHEAFTPSRLKKSGALLVGFLHAPLSSKSQQLLMGHANSMDDFHVHGRELYWLFKKKQSESTFSNAVCERILGVPTTFRGMNTVRKMADKYAAS